METLHKKNKPLIIFFLIAFILAWGLMGIAVAQNYGLNRWSIPLEPILLIGSWIPNIAAFIVIAFVLKRHNGIRKLLRGWLKVKVPVFWYMVSLSPLVLSALSVFIYKIMYGVVPVDGIVFDPASLVVLLVMITLTGAMGEELGWRGFALPWLLSRMNAFNASILLGLIWVLWHTPLWFAGLGFEEIPFMAYAVIGISFTVLVTWACNNSRGSLAIASLFHLTLNVSVNVIESKALYIHAFLFLIFAAFVVSVYGPSRLSGSGLPVNKETNEWLS
jgi:uncharacterized protein